MEIILPLLAGFTLGCIHAFDVDHIVAVTAFASKRPSAAGAAKFGFMWGLGHTTTLVILGALSIIFRFAIPPLMESIAEMAVGLLLIAIGVWVVWTTVRRKHIHVHKHTHDGVEHVHVHSHEHGEDHRHSHSMFWVGATHGLAGTAAVMVVVPVAISQSIFTASLYLLLFGVGTMTAMSIFAYTIGTLVARVPSNSVLTWFQALSGLASITIGFLWIGAKII
ncbi:MAG: sulfite exporter TauE/SafE family protein [Ignavibacteriae bacterium]|nr:sulfite exporter TauE/SafE family protein [Ignavibacteriota bacterium]